MEKAKKKKKQSRKVRLFPGSGGCGGKERGVTEVVSCRDFGVLALVTVSDNFKGDMPHKEA